MDRLRGDFSDYSDTEGYDPSEDEIGHEAPPPAVGQDERRLQVRAYNHWASLLGDRPCPLIDDLAIGHLPDFDPYAVLLDFAEGVDHPVVKYVGQALADESGCAGEPLRHLADVPARTLLSRITDHYLQIFGNQAPVGFEAEFVNQRGRTILYRGILLPFARDAGSEGIDCIYGVINWKELADQQTTDALMDAIDRVLMKRTPPRREAEPLTEWADGPADLSAPADEPLDLGVFSFAPDADWNIGRAASLADILASARELAHSARSADDRSRQALYEAIGRAHEFALAADSDPDGLRELVADAGLVMQERAPLIPVVKLVFGADYDKTRLTEYATVIAHARRIALPAGELARFLAGQAGGLKGVVQLERGLRRAEAGQTDVPAPDRLAARLRLLPARPLAPQGEEFALVLARRTPAGEVVLLGEVTDPGLLERAARRLLD
ncbi:hypothetical protein ACFOD9_11890 [Novosphingobium bradum]|uniref:PAS domain-containing protein n=1 Tax=Novosphingobium bradum TaxID=1737444 RepID=A0ABV7IWH3_9SPHN